MKSSLCLSVPTLHRQGIIRVWPGYRVVEKPFFSAIGSTIMMSWMVPQNLAVRSWELQSPLLEVGRGFNAEIHHLPHISNSLPFSSFTSRQFLLLRLFLFSTLLFLYPSFSLPFLYPSISLLFSSPFCSLCSFLSIISCFSI